MTKIKEKKTLRTQRTNYNEEANDTIKKKEKVRMMKNTYVSMKY